MDNYIVINGKKAEFTEEQLKALGIGIEEEKKRNNPFNSELKDGDIHFIAEEVKSSYYDPITDKYRLNNVNSFNDKDFANQIYLHELLNRKLLKYAWDNNAEDCSEWDCENLHYHIIFSNRIDKFFVGYDDSNKYSNIVYFSKMGVAEQAIKDVIKPFMIEHPEFVW